MAGAGFLRHGSAMPRTIDARDRQITEILRADAWISYAALAKRIHLSPSAVQRRVERLIAEGVIRGARAEVAIDAPPAPLRVLLLAELVDDSAGVIDRLAAALADASEVVDARYVTGEADVALTLELPDMAAYDQFVARNINRSGVIRRFKTFAALRRLK
jgi:DNA-binding Lrp family transcriptional regulator